MERSWCGCKGSYAHTHRIHRTDNPGNERVWGDCGADVRIEGIYVEDLIEAGRLVEDYSRSELDRG